GKEGCVAQAVRNFGEPSAVSPAEWTIRDAADARVVGVVTETLHITGLSAALRALRGRKEKRRGRWLRGTLKHGNLLLPRLEVRRGPIQIAVEIKQRGRVA